MASDTDVTAFFSQFEDGRGKPCVISLFVYNELLGIFGDNSLSYYTGVLSKLFNIYCLLLTSKIGKLKQWDVINQLWIFPGTEYPWKIS